MLTFPEYRKKRKLEFPLESRNTAKIHYREYMNKFKQCTQLSTTQQLSSHTHQFIHPSNTSFCLSDSVGYSSLDYVKKGNIMESVSVPTEISVEKSKRDQLLSELSFAEDRHDADLRKMFFLIQPKPDTIEELIFRIKSGDYNKSEKSLKKSAFDIMYADFWETKTPDQKGFKQAKDKLREVYSDAHIAVSVLPVEQGLEELRKFKAWTYTVS